VTFLMDFFCFPILVEPVNEFIREGTIFVIVNFDSKGINDFEVDFSNVIFPSAIFMVLL